MPPQFVRGKQYPQSGQHSGSPSRTAMGCYGNLGFPPSSLHSFPPVPTHTSGTINRRSHLLGTLCVFKLFFFQKELEIEATLNDRHHRKLCGNRARALTTFLKESLPTLIVGIILFQKVEAERTKRIPSLEAFGNITRDRWRGRTISSPASLWRL